MAASFFRFECTVRYRYGTVQHYTVMYRIVPLPYSTVPLDRLIAMLGPGGALYDYSNDVYLLTEHEYMSYALADAPTIYNRAGLRNARGPRKTKLILPLVGCDPFTFLLPLALSSHGAPHLVCNRQLSSLRLFNKANRQWTREQVSNRASTL